jgi:hypothetical protein
LYKERGMRIRGWWSVRMECSRGSLEREDWEIETCWIKEV